MGRVAARGARRSDKAARFNIARGEVGECQAALEMAAAVGLLSLPRCDYLSALADRIAAMLRGLIKQRRGLAAP